MRIEIRAKSRDAFAELQRGAADTEEQWLTRVEAASRDAGLTPMEVAVVYARGLRPDVAAETFQRVKTGTTNLDVLYAGVLAAREAARAIAATTPASALRAAPSPLTATPGAHAAWADDDAPPFAMWAAPRGQSGAAVSGRQHDSPGMARGAGPGKGGSPNISDFLLRFTGGEGVARPRA